MPAMRALAVRAVLQVERQRLADLPSGVLDAPAGDVALLLEDLGDVRLELASAASRHVSWYAEFALRRRVSMSAIGSVIVMWPVASLAGFPAVVRGGPTAMRFGICGRGGEPDGVS